MLERKTGTIKRAKPLPRARVPLFNHAYVVGENDATPAACFSGVRARNRAPGVNLTSSQNTKTIRRQHGAIHDQGSRRREFRALEGFQDAPASLVPQRCPASVCRDNTRAISRE